MIKEQHLYNIIKGKYYTEKSTKLEDTLKCITFKVDKNANKYSIKNALEKIFNIKILSVHTINVKGKRTKFKNHPGKKKNFKKAIIKLKEGYQINIDKIE